ncbi:MAG: hypothetical protein Tsb0013_09420 [Phycisphaerales bacterium]
MPEASASSIANAHSDKARTKGESVRDRGMGQGLPSGVVREASVGDSTYWGYPEPAGLRVQPPPPMTMSLRVLGRRSVSGMVPPKSPPEEGT